MDFFKKLIASIGRQRDLPVEWMEYILGERPYSDLFEYFPGLVVTYGRDGGLLLKQQGFLVLFKDGSGRLLDIGNRYMRIDGQGRVYHQKNFDFDNSDPLVLMEFPKILHSWQRGKFQSPETIDEKSEKFRWLKSVFASEVEDAGPTVSKLNAFSFLRTITAEGQYLNGWDFIGPVSAGGLSLIDY